MGGEKINEKTIDSVKLSEQLHGPLFIVHKLTPTKQSDNTESSKCTRDTIDPKDPTIQGIVMT